jgi:hypothetical protein
MRIRAMTPPPMYMHSSSFEFGCSPNGNRAFRDTGAPRAGQMRTTSFAPAPSAWRRHASATRSSG